MEGMPDDVPDLLNVGAIPSNQSAMIDTDILEPVIFSQDFITFQIENIGSNSASLTRGFLPVGVGISSLIRRATLKIGTKTICEIDDFNHWSAYKSMFMSNETNKEREQYLSGRGISHSQFYSGARGTAAYFPDQGALSSHIGLDNGQEYIYPTPVGVGANNTAELEVMDFQLVENKGVFSITLDAYAKKNSTLQFTYMDYRLTKSTLSEVDAQNQIRNVGGAGRLVPRMFVGINKNACNTTGSDGWKTGLNKYISYACETGGLSGADTYGRLTSNIKKNDVFLYPIDRTNTALHFQAVKDTEGMLPFISRSEYSRQGDRMTPSTLEKVSQSDSLQGNFFWTAYRMPDGERVNSRGLELTSKMNSLKAGTYTSRCWIEIVKVATLIDGQFNCYYA